MSAPSPAPSPSAPDCELCEQAGGELAYQDEKLRVALVGDASYPGFCRVIWRSHSREMSDLSFAARNALMEAVWQVEMAVRDVMRPDKVNLASLGNMTPHLHWHVIPRYLDDAHFPSPVWAEPQRATPAAVLAARTALLPQLRAAIAARLAPSPSPLP
jgi:diadenosine tetraphosphate (Ap4A) HIT family hydrolase